MTLYLAGAGYHPWAMTVEVIEVLRRADVVYVDTYTMPGADWVLDKARSLSSGRVLAAGRSTLEEGSKGIIKESRGAEVVILVPGDPLVATTHSSILAEAAEAGVEVRVYPGVSGVCASKAVSLLHYYRFGRTVTVPGPWRHVKAYSLVEAVYANLCVGLHTLLLLDVVEGGRGQLSPGEAAREIEALDEALASEAGYEPVLGRLPVIVVSAGVGGSHEVIPLATLTEARGRAWRGVYSMIVPAELHPSEEWVLKAVHGFQGYDRQAYRLAEKVCGLLRLSTRGASILP